MIHHFPHEKRTVFVKVRFVRWAFAFVISFMVAAPALLILLADNPIEIKNIFLRVALWVVVCIAPALFLAMLILLIFEKRKPITLRFPHKRDPKKIY